MGSHASRTCHIDPSRVPRLNWHAECTDTCARSAWNGGRLYSPPYRSLVSDTAHRLPGEASLGYHTFLCPLLEAIRKSFRTVAARSSSILTVMKRRAIAGIEPIEHKVYMTDLDHSRTGFYTALIVLAVPAVPAIPGVRPLHHPAFLQRWEAFRAR